MWCMMEMSCILDLTSNHSIILDQENAVMSVFPKLVMPILPDVIIDIRGGVFV